jgi:hypothetical protein
VIALKSLLIRAMPAVLPVASAMLLLIGLVNFAGPCPTADGC